MIEQEGAIFPIRMLATQNWQKVPPVFAASKNVPPCRTANHCATPTAFRLKGLAIVLLTAAALPAFAHGGGTDAVSCHSDHEKIGFHCHAQCDRLTSFLIDGQPTTTLPQQTAASQIYTTQVLLRQIGIDVGAADGIFGPKTHKGVETFQSAAGLPVDGQIDDRLVAQLATVAQCETPNLALSDILQ